MLRKCAGLHTAVHSLRSKKDLGTGEFFDLIPLIDWCKESGLKVIKLYPVHDTSLTDTERDASPFSVLSAFSLHPNYINIRTLAPEFEEEVHPIAKVLNRPSLEYRRTFLAKNELLRMLFLIRKEDDLASKAFERFFKKNEEHLKNYALFSFLKEKYGTANFHEWGRYNEEEICEKHQDKLDFHYFVQFHLHQQLKKVVEYAKAQEVILSVDFPVAVHPHSVEAWKKVDPEAKLHWIEQYFQIIDTEVTFFQLCDLYAMNDDLKAPDTEFDLAHYRSHIYVEELLMIKSFSAQIREMASKPPKKDRQS